MARKKAEDLTPAEVAAKSFKPGKTPAKGTDEYEGTVNTMRDRIVSSYTAATPHEHWLGEQFYPREAHGAAQALAGGVDPDSSQGKALRRTGGKTAAEYGHSDIDASYGNRPDMAASAHAAHDFRARNAGSMRPIPGQAENDAAFRAKKAEPEHAERVHRAAGVLAKTSPQTPWDLNVTQAHEAYHIHETSPETLGKLQRGEDRDPDNWQNVKGQWSQKRVQVLHEGTGKTTALGSQSTATITAAHDIAMGKAQPEDHVANDDTHRVKIGSFQNNIEHPQGNNVTVDFRAHDISEGVRLPTSAEHGLSANRKSKSRDEAGRRYDMLEDAHHRAAEFINTNHADRRIGAKPVDGKTVQASTWWADRNDQKAREGGVAGTGIGADRSGTSPVGQHGRPDMHVEPNPAAGRAFSPEAQRQSINLSRPEAFKAADPSAKRAYGTPAPKAAPKDNRTHQMGPASPDRLAEVRTRAAGRESSNGWTPTSAL